MDGPIQDAYTVGASDEDDDGDGKLALNALYSQYRSRIDEVKKDAADAGDLVANEPTPGAEESELPNVEASAENDEYDETTYDGYQAILKDDWGASEADLRKRCANLESKTA